MRIKVRPSRDEVYYVYLDSLKAVYLASGIKEVSKFDNIIEVYKFIEFCKNNKWRVYDEDLLSVNS